MCGLRAIYSGRIIEDIKRDLASGNVTMETVEKRVRLDMETGKAVVDLLNPRPMCKMLLELIWAEQANALRTNRKNQIYRLSNLRSLDKWVGEVSIG